MGKHTNTERPPRGRDALRAARIKRGWGFHNAKIPGVAQQVLRNLEGDVTANRQTDPGDVRLRTALAVLEAYWPEVQLSDLVPGTRFKLTRQRGASPSQTG